MHVEAFAVFAKDAGSIPATSTKDISGKGENRSFERECRFFEDENRKGACAPLSFFLKFCRI